MLLAGKGQGLLEVLVALFLLALVSTSFLSLVTATSAGLYTSQRRQAAVRCAQSVIEQVHSPGVQVMPAYGPCDDARYPRMTWAVELAGDKVRVVVYADSSRSTALFSLDTILFAGVAQP